MPIKPENRKLYPPNWKDISQQIRNERAHEHCEDCGVGNNAVILRKKDGSWRYVCAQEWDMIHSRVYYSNYTMLGAIKSLGFTRVILTVAHLDHNPANCDGMESGGPMLPKEESNLRAWCQRCHLMHDREFHARNRRLSRRCQYTMELPI